MTAEMRVLVVDDNEMNRDVLTRRLERQGYEVVTAEDGAQALETLAKESFDLMLLDIMMPNVNGYEVLERLKNDVSKGDMPVIVVSAADELDSVVRCIELGAEDYLFKPFNPVLLKARVKACAEKKRLREQALARAAEPLVPVVQQIQGIIGELAEEAEQLTLGGPLTTQQQDVLQKMQSQMRLLSQQLGIVETALFRRPLPSEEPVD